MKSTRSVPPQWLVPFGLQFIFVPIAVLAALLLPAVSAARHGDPSLLYTSMAFAVVGIVLLFFARLPLYKQHKFFTFGPTALPSFHRKLYRAAYVFICIAVVLMLLLIAALK
jgi:uncharacterized membrane protein